MSLYIISEYSVSLRILSSLSDCCFRRVVFAIARIALFDFDGATFTADFVVYFITRLVVRVVAESVTGLSTLALVRFAY